MLLSSPKTRREEETSRRQTIVIYIDLMLCSAAKQHVVVCTYLCIEMELPGEVVLNLFTFFPPFEIFKSVLSNRRNKGNLSTDGKIVFKSVNLSFLNSGSNDGISSSILREYIILKTLKCPNVVCLLSARLTDENTVCFQYPYFSTTLCDIKIPSVDLVREIAHQLFRALSFVHSNSVVHRNLKPDNILVSSLSPPTIVLADWASSRLVVSTNTCTTPDESRNRVQTVKERARLVYKAPESLLRVKSASFSIDMWACGVILAQLLTDTPLPWASASSESEILFRQISQFGSLPTDLELSYFFLHRQICPDSSPGETNWLSNINESTGRSLIRRLFEMDPQKRISAKSALLSGFVLGVSNDGVAVSPNRPVHTSSSFTTCPKRSLWVPWLMKLAAHIFENQSSVSVHRAVWLVDQLGKYSSVHFASALKICSRIENSKDAYRQTNCVDVSIATGIDSHSLLRCEMEIFNSGVLAKWMSSHTIFECIHKIVPDQRLLQLGLYIGDLALIDEELDSFDNETIAFACLIAANQWIADNTDLLLPGGYVLVDQVQMALTRCVFIIRRDISHPNHSWYPNSVPPLPLVWFTGRAYIESVIGPSTPPATPVRRTIFRTSSIAHANAWAAETRRRSRSARKRTLSTPMRLTPGPTSKLIVNKSNSPPKPHDENTHPNQQQTPQRRPRDENTHLNQQQTPHRRSVRLKRKHDD